MKKYQIIYADPPWRYVGNEVLAEVSRLTDKSTHQYSTMKLEDIKKLPIESISDENALLFLWVVSPILDGGIEVLKAWGFNFATVGFVWHKKKINPGYYTLSSCEICLIGKKGKIPTPRGKRNIEQFLSQERQKHSEKPHEIRKRIAEMFPEQSKIELFSRDETQQNLFGFDKFQGWDKFGNEVESDINL